MKDFEFYHHYANVPLTDRMSTEIVYFDQIPRSMKLYDIYHRMQEIDDKLRPLTIEKQKLLEAAEKYFKNGRKN